MWALHALCTMKQIVQSSASVVRSSVAATGSSRNSGFRDSCGHCLTQYRWKKIIVYNKITKNALLRNKKRDSGFENVMDAEKPMRILKRIINLIMKTPEKKVSYQYLLLREKSVGIGQQLELSDFIKKYPHVVSVFQDASDKEYWVTVAEPVIFLMEEEKQMKKAMVQAAVVRLQKVLMMSVTRRIPLDTIALLSDELGLPDDFKKSVIKANPHLFKLVKSPRDKDKEVHPKVRLWEWDNALAVPAIEEYRKRLPAHTCYTFPLSFPHGFKLTRYKKNKFKRWQKLSYRSPYENTKGLDMKSPEAAKRAVAVLHEFLHIAIGHRTQVDRISRLRAVYRLPDKIGKTVLQNPGIFYMSIKSNIQTIFLRDAFMKGHVIEKDPLLSFKERFLELVQSGKWNYRKRAKELEGLDRIFKFQLYQRSVTPLRKQRRNSECEDIKEEKLSKHFQEHFGGVRREAVRDAWDGHGTAHREDFDKANASDGDERSCKCIYDELEKGEASDVVYWGESDGGKEDALAEDVESADENESEVATDDESGDVESGDDNEYEVAAYDDNDDELDEGEDKNGNVDDTDVDEKSTRWR